MPTESGRAWRGRIRPNLHFGIMVYVIAFTLVALGFLTGHARTDLTGMVFLAVLILGGVTYSMTFFMAWKELTVRIEGDVLRVEARYGGLGRSVKEQGWSIRRGELARLRERRVLWMHGIWLYDSSDRMLTGFQRFLDERENEEMVTAILEWGGQPSSRSDTVAEGASR